MGQLRTSIDTLIGNLEEQGALDPGTNPAGYARAELARTLADLLEGEPDVTASAVARELRMVLAELTAGTDKRPDVLTELMRRLATPG